MGGDADQVNSVPGIRSRWFTGPFGLGFSDARPLPLETAQGDLGCLNGGAAYSDGPSEADQFRARGI